MQEEKVRYANVGRNYWGFDSTLAAAWFNQKTGAFKGAAVGAATGWLEVVIERE